jgi:hypothetical protein
MRNPIPELLTDEQYRQAKRLGLIRGQRLLEYLVKRDYHRWFKRGMSPEKRRKVIRRLSRKYKRNAFMLYKIIYTKKSPSM